MVPVGPLDRNVVQGGQDLLLARAESVMPMLIERRDHVVAHRLLDRRCQVQRLHPGVDNHEEAGQRGDETVGQALRLGQMCTQALGQIRFLGDRLQARKQRPQTRLQLLGRLRLSRLDLIGMIDLAEGADRGFGLDAVRVGLLAREAGLDVSAQRLVDARGERRRAPGAMAAAMIGLLGGAGDRRALTLPSLLRLRRRLPMLGAIQAIMDWRGASICTRVNAGRSIGQRPALGQFALPRVRLPGAPPTPYRALDRLPKHPVLDQAMIQAR